MNVERTIRLLLARRFLLIVNLSTSGIYSIGIAMRPAPTDGYSITLRLRLVNKPAVLGLVTSTIGNVGGSIGAIDIVEAGFDTLVRDITIAAGNEQHAEEIVESVKVLPGVTFINYSDRVFLIHIGGKIEIKSKIPVQTCSSFAGIYAWRSTGLQCNLRRSNESFYPDHQTQ